MKSMKYFRLTVLAVLFFIVLSFFQSSLSPFWSNVRLAAAFVSWGLLMATMWHRQEEEEKEQQQRRTEILRIWGRKIPTLPLKFTVWMIDESGKNVEIKPWAIEGDKE